MTDVVIQKHGVLVDAVSLLVAPIAGLVQSRQAYGTLMAFDDRMLDDIGFNRGDIKRAEDTLESLRDRLDELEKEFEQEVEETEDMSYWISDIKAELGSSSSSSFGSVASARPSSTTLRTP